MKRIVIALLCVLGVRSASARIGESWEDIEKRYGHQVFTQLKDSLGNHQYVYYYKDLTVVVTYIDKRSVCEDFRKKEKGKSLTENEVDTILAANGTDWRRDTPLMRTADNKLFAAVINNDLRVMTQAYALQITAHDQAEEKKKLNGL